MPKANSVDTDQTLISVYTVCQSEAVSWSVFTLFVDQRSTLISMYTVCLAEASHKMSNKIYKRLHLEAKNI